ncbi:BREX-2 system adenine-specific DNA-methyltransferase PglX [Dankookia rubra]|uniref:site-specific DNA-methyltransferase (adenine-specific) n=1 Tax=Dankookia rubra TaxID=1442381 RepID=A0A4R5QFC7_9PROT|nr:BREX-2 system adenine-specific DNA-methyltransferase PglX [Dankookia rubra]TDH61147.1 BREX-2 system adenine-specific DNA-methyltransferase PglX [Dankookia rubra]
MVDAKQLLTDLKRLRRRLDEDLRQHHRDSPGRAAVQVEWQAAFEARRTADTFETFWTAALDQAAVHWILAVVFLRFLEDNRLVDRPLLSGPGERLELAQLRQREFFRARPQDSDAEFLLETFAEAARLPGLAGLYDPAHNPLFRLPLSGDGAMALLAFFRDRVPETGALLHEFTDPDWSTRFLGDLYQDLSEDARKRFALLQTPDFVEEWILSRTLDPAIREFGYEHVTMIDPTCGSGHFLLGGFARILAEWQRHAPDMPPAAQAQRALDAVSGVDLNPFAVEIARFRLLLAAVRAAGETRLAAAADFRFSLAVGDSLFHGTHFFRAELGGAAEGFGRRRRHHYTAEDTAAHDVILGRQYHAVVGNPPYIQPPDAAMRDAYREIYDSCHMKYALAAPFTERFFDLTQQESDREPAGFVGLIVDNSFMKRQFGSRLIERVLARLDLTHVVNCSGVPLPGHNTSTAILFGRNRPPVSSVVRTVRGIKGDPDAVADPARGQLWTAILTQTDQAKSESAFISTEDTPRAVLARHPWNMGGGGAAEVQEAIERDRPLLASLSPEIGFGCIISEEEAFMIAGRRDVPPGTVPVRDAIIGEEVRDWSARSSGAILFPYDGEINLTVSARTNDVLWPWKALLLARRDFGNRSYREVGRSFAEYHQIPIERNRTPLTITFGEIATHNHFVLDRGGKVFNRTAPVIKLPPRTSEDAHLSLLGLLNSSIACFWLKARCKDKGGDHVGTQGARIQNTSWDERYAFNATNVGQFPLASERPVDLARTLDTEAQRLSANRPAALCEYAVPKRAALDIARTEINASRARMIALQEELDWRCYRLYGLCDGAPEHPAPPPLRFGERAFEIVMARRMSTGALESAWFTRHRSTPITDLPAHWPEDYRAIVERRITLIETDPTIGLIERPEYKRRWSMAPWEEMERDALRLWLLERLEETRFWPRDDPRLTSTLTLADAARHDADFLAVAALYAGHATFDLDVLVAELVTKEAVPFLAALRYAEAGLRKRADWEATWEKQRAEDAIDADLAGRRDEFVRIAWSRLNPKVEDETAEAYATRMLAGLGTEAVQQAADRDLAAEGKRRKQEEVGTIAVPPKYKTADFLSQDFWRLRGGLDVPKERFLSFPHCARDADASLPVLWAGHDHLARAKAIAGWYVERKDVDGWAAPRLAPLLAGLLELVPWLRQWHNAIDPETGLRMGEYFAEFVGDEARSLGLTLAELRAWTPPAPTRRPRGRRAAA